MDNNFVVTTRLLTEKADTIGKINVDFKDIMAQISRLIHSLSNEWQSDAADEFVIKFESLENEFTNYYGVVTSYETFLRRAAEDYVTAETKIQGGIA